MDFVADSNFRTVIYLAISLVLIPSVLLLLSKVALASLQPEPHEFSEVRRLAKRLDDLVHGALQQATHAYSSAPGERRALDELIRFVDAVETFGKSFRSAGRRHSSLHRDFMLLQTDYDRAARQFRALLAFQLSNEKFLALSATMEELRFYYAAPHFEPRSTSRKAEPGPRPKSLP